MEYAADGTATPTQDAGDCRKVVCDGAGSTKSVVDDDDLPDDSNPCTSDICTDGEPSHADFASGTSCGEDLVCDGAGACVGCVQASDCAGQDTECATRTCEDNKCGVAYMAAGTPVSVQTPGDCLKSQCDGSGDVESVVDDDDLPVDNDPCTLDVCTSGAASNPPAPAKTACGVGGEDVCDGAGVCVACIEAGDCPGSDTECATRTCDPAHVCGVQYTAEGTLLAGQLVGDCLQRTCDGNGGEQSTIDDFDMPDDGNDCTIDSCSGGVVTQVASAARTGCDDDNGAMCDGSGHCVVCVDATDCAGVDTDCLKKTCIDGMCGTAPTAQGTVLTVQVDGDCQTAICDGNGGESTQEDNSDVLDDGNDCTADACAAGMPTHVPLDAKTPCGSNGGSLCDGAGACVGCVVPEDCSGTDGVCGVRTCVSGQCGRNDQPAGTVIASQIAGDCKVNKCDGAGNVVVSNDNTDVPVDGKQCTQDLCTNGTPSNPAQPAGTPCSESEGTSCNSLKQCIPTYYLLRVGTGTGALSTSAAPAFLEQRDAYGTPVGPVVALPVAASGGQRAFTLSGTDVNGGRLSRSNDGKYVVALGYSQVPGTATPYSVLPSASAPRVVLRVSSTGVVDTSTGISLASASGNARTAVSNNGTGMWAAGSVGGITYVPFGTTGGVQISTTPALLYSLQAFGGQLYGASYTTVSGFNSVFKVGTGFPTTATQTCTTLTGLPTASGPNPYEFVMFDRSSSVPGLDTLYLADARAATTGGVIQKWTFNGTTWTRATFTVGLPVGVRGLTGWVYQGKVQLIATSTDTLTKVFWVEDDGTTAPPYSMLLQASANTAYRGVSVVPR